MLISCIIKKGDRNRRSFKSGTGNIELYTPGLFLIK
jgi:hypothetical protein